MRTCFAATALFALAACGPNPADPGPGGVTVSEAEALDDAADMLDARRPAPPAIASPTPNPSEEPAQ